MSACDVGIEGVVKDVGVGDILDPCADELLARTPRLGSDSQSCGPSINLSHFYFFSTVLPLMIP